WGDRPERRPKRVLRADHELPRSSRSWHGENAYLLRVAQAVESQEQPLPDDERADDRSRKQREEPGEPYSRRSLLASRPHAFGDRCASKKRTLRLKASAAAPGRYASGRLSLRNGSASALETAR